MGNVIVFAANVKVFITTKFTDFKIFSTKFIANLKNKFQRNSRSRPSSGANFNTRTPLNRPRRSDFASSNSVRRQPSRFQSHPETGNESKSIVKKIIGFPMYLWHSGFFKTKKFQFILLPLLIMALVGSYAYYWFFYVSSSTFRVTIKYKYLPITQSKVLTASADSPDYKTTKLEEQEEVASFSTPTGEKVVGEKATGNIMLYNTSADIKVFPKGTVLTCTTAPCNGLTYQTLSDVNLGAGASSVAVLAGDIGLGFNQKINQKFKIQGQKESEVFGANVEELKGGTEKKIVKIVSKEDLTRIEEEAMKEAKERLLIRFKSNPNYSKYIISEASIKVEKIQSTADKKEGDEAELVNFTLTTKGTVDAFPSENITRAVEQLKTEVTPAGYYLDTRQTNSNSKVIAQDANKIQIEVTLNTIARPTIDTEKIANDLKGKNYKDAPKVLSTVPNIISYSTTYSPTTLPTFFWTIPSGSGRINFEFIAEK